MLQADLTQCIASGNLRRAASSLVVDYGSDVLATCMAIVRDRTAAEDLTQDIFSDAIRGLSSFRGDAAPRTWLLSIARHRCIDYLRARKRDPARDLWSGPVEDDARDPDAHPDEGATGHEWLLHRDQVRLALDVLEEGDRALVVLRFKNGLDYGELAAAFGLREGTVRMRVSRALARMRAALEPTAPRAAPAMPAPLPGGTPARGAAPPPAPPPPAPAARSIGMGAPPAAPPALASPAPSWWQRLRAWASASTHGPTTPAPVGDVGAMLAASEPSTPSEALAARLGQLVDRLP